MTSPFLPSEPSSVTMIVSGSTLLILSRKISSELLREPMMTLTSLPAAFIAWAIG